MRSLIPDGWFCWCIVPDGVSLVSPRLAYFSACCVVVLAVGGVFLLQLNSKKSPYLAFGAPSTQHWAQCHTTALLPAVIGGLGSSG